MRVVFQVIRRNFIPETDARLDGRWVRGFGGEVSGCGEEETAGVGGDVPCS